MLRRSHGTAKMDATYNLNGAFKPTAKRNADLNGPDFFPTPKWATHALMESEIFHGPIWECACGDGAMSQVIEQYSPEVESSDLYDRGYGDVGVDFLSTQRKFANIITNPPYNSAQGFVSEAVRQATDKFALLLRLAFLEGANRAKTVFSETPPSRLWVFSERITFYPKGVKRAGSGTTAYAWFVWDKSHSGVTELRWLPPGFKKLYS